MTQTNKEIIKAYIPTFVVYILSIIGFFISISYSVGKAEERFISQFKSVASDIASVSLADLNHHQTAMGAISTAINERQLMLKPVYDHMERESSNDRDLAGTLMVISRELTALRVGQENTNRRIDEMRAEARK